MNIPEPLNSFTKEISINAKAAIGDAKKVALAQAWQLLQLMIAEIIQAIEANYTTLVGADKKAIAMACVSQFYDTVFVTVTVPFIPSIFQPIIYKYVKSLLMLLVSSTIDAMVTTFRNTGIFIKH